MKKCAEGQGWLCARRLLWLLAGCKLAPTAISFSGVILFRIPVFMARSSHAHCMRDFDRQYMNLLIVNEIIDFIDL
jgi:hypothetical protein